MPPFVILTGASGSGKTAIAEAIERARPSFAGILRFDSIGVPTRERMAAERGSGEAWQRAMTVDWLKRIAALRSSARRVREGLRLAGAIDARVVPVDCDDETRRRRLVADRNQPELATARMMNWAAFLRRDARRELRSSRHERSFAGRLCRAGVRAAVRAVEALIFLLCSEGRPF